MVKLEKFFGFLTFMYNVDKKICKLTLGQISGLGIVLLLGLCMISTWVLVSSQVRREVVQFLD